MNKNQREKSQYVVNNKISIFYQIRDVLLTFMLWGLWVYIFYPLIALILWRYFDTDIFYNRSLEEIEALESSLYLFLLSASAIIFLLTMSFNGWGYYNKQRFKLHGNKRKKQQKSISSQMIADALQIDVKSIKLCKESRYIQIYHLNKNPNPKEDLFKPTEGLNVKTVSLYFSDNWDQVRKSSNFGYTHEQTKKDKEKIA